jgi:hypothetical protein
MSPSELFEEVRYALTDSNDSKIFAKHIVIVLDPEVPRSNFLQERLRSRGVSIGQSRSNKSK